MTQADRDEADLHRATLAILEPQRRLISAEIRGAKRKLRLLKAKDERAKLRRAIGDA